MLLDLGSLDATQCRPLVAQCRELKLPVLAVVPKDRVFDLEPSLNPDEFILCPFAQDELVARVKQAIYRVNGPSGNQVLKTGHLAIDLEKYEVMLKCKKVWYCSKRCPCNVHKFFSNVQHWARLPTGPTTKNSAKRTG